MVDPLTQVVGLLPPSASFSKLVLAGGAWTVRRDDHGHPFYAVVLERACRLAIDGEAGIVLSDGDFVLISAASAFAASSLVAPSAGWAPPPVEVGPGVFWLGPPERPPDLRMLVGHCTFACVDVDLPLSLLPRFVHVRGVERLAVLLGLVNEETRADRPGRDVVLARLLEVPLVEVLRSTAGPTAPSGLLRGLADERVAAALRRMHERPTAPWTVAALAREAGLSRSIFFERFRREVGIAPMAYLLAWRIALAKDLLGREGAGVAEVAERVGYGTPSTFSTAFARHVGRPPIQYAREQRPRPCSPAPLNG